VVACPGRLRGRAKLAIRIDAYTHPEIMPGMGFERLVLDLVAEVQGTLDLGEMRELLIDALARAVPVNWIALNDIGEDPERNVFLIRPALTEEQVQTFGRLAHENPLLDRWRRTRDGRAYRFSDVIADDQLAKLTLYREFYLPLGIRYQIAFTLPSPSDRVLAIAMCREESDFTDAERDLLNEARPFLIQAYRNALEHSTLKAQLGIDGLLDPGVLAESLRRRGLTGREAEVLAHVAIGRSQAETAARLGVALRTVHKHLERAYRKLGVNNRAEAIAVSWSLEQPGGRQRRYAGTGRC
jgi:DNA-binding CsgD family transcriptional regulator